MQERNKRVLIAAPVHRILLEKLSEEGFEYDIRLQITQAEAHECIGEYAGVVTSTRLLLDRALLSQARRLEWIGRMGSGMEIIDLGAAAEFGIRCYSSPEGNCGAVAEHAVGLLLSLTNKIASSYREVRHGHWNRDENRGWELEGRTLGIIGFGFTGSALAARLSGFGMRILAHDTNPKASYPNHVRRASSADIQAEAEIISLHLPLRPDTYHYFNQQFLDACRKRIWLINTSRGQVADLSVIYAGLRSGAICGAGLDVLPEEPASKATPAHARMLEEMYGMENVVVTPHTAGYSHEAVLKMSRALCDKIFGSA